MNGIFTSCKRPLSFVIFFAFFWLNSINLQAQTTVSADEDTICSGDTTLLVASGADVYEWSPSGSLSSNTGDSVLAYPTVTTTYMVVGTRTAIPIEVDTVYITITVIQTLLADAGADDTICEGDSYTLSGQTGGGVSGAGWTSSGDGTFNDTSLVNAVYTPGANDISNGSVILTLTAVDTTGTCPEASDNMVLTVDPAATANAGPNETICEGIGFVLSGSIGGGAGSSTWSTSGDGSFDDVNDTNATYTPGSNDINNGVVILTLTTDDPAGPCMEATDDVVLNIDRAPIVDAGSDEIICGNIPDITLNGAVSGGTTTGMWSSNGLGSFDDATLLNATYTIDPTDSIVVFTLTSTNNGVCAAAEDSVTLTILDSVNVTLTLQDDTVCSGTSTMWSASGAASYAWSPSTGLEDTTGASIIAAPEYGVTYQVIGETSGCADTVTVPVTILELPDLTLTIPDDTLCEGLTDEWIAESTTAIDFQWTPGSYISPNQGDTVSITAVMDSVYTVTAIGPDGCTYTDTVDFTVTPAPTANAGSDQTVCGNIADVSLNGSITVATGGLWTTSGTGSFDDPTLLNAIYSPSLADSTNASVVLNLETTGNGDCLAAQDSMTIYFVDSIVVEVTVEDSVLCEGQSTLWVASGADQYTWNPSSGLSPSTGDSVIATVQTGTNYQVTGSVIGCTDTKTVPVTVLSAPSITVSTPNDTLCETDTDEWIASSNTDSVIVWTPTNSYDADTGNTVTATAVPDSVYIATAINKNGCETADTVDVYVKPLPEISFMLEHDTLCQGDTTIWEVSGADSYSWEPASGLNMTTGDSITAVPYADTVYQVTALLKGCIDSAVVPVIVGNAPPVITLVAEKDTICENLFTTLTASGDVDNDIYNWSPATGLDTTIGASVIAGPLSTTTYTVSATLLACPGDTTITLTVLPKPAMAASLDHGGTICSNEEETVTIMGDPLEIITHTYPDGGVYSTTQDFFVTKPDSTTTVTVTGTDANGCKNTIYVVINVDTCVFADYHSLNEGISAYVDGNGNMVVTLKEAIAGDFMLTVHDLMGRQVYAEPVSKMQGGQERYIIPVGDKATGVYMLNVTSAEGRFDQKLFKQ